MLDTGFPGRPSTRGRPKRANHQRLAGSHGNPPEIKLHARSDQGCLHEVIVAHGCSAERDDDVCTRRAALLHGCLDRGPVVGD